MKIFTHSVYKYREVFLRELLSNAADALEKIRNLSLGKSSLLAGAPSLNVTVTIDKERKTLLITDYGVGMSYDELKKNLGTIAQSGTAEFLGKLADSENKDGKEGGKDVADSSSFIGQFGVGFYSVFLVADKVAVASKSYKEDKQYVWISDGQGTFTIAEDPRGPFLSRGTEITLFLKDDSLEYLEETQIETLVKKYSAFVGFPIYLVKSKTEKIELDEPAEAPLDGEEEKKTEGEEGDSKEPKVEDDKEEEDGDKAKEEPKKKTVERTVREPVLINENKPIWTRKPSEVTEEEYNDFYKAFAQETSNPLTHIHFRAEGAFSSEKKNRGLSWDQGSHKTQQNASKSFRPIRRGCVAVHLPAGMQPCIPSKVLVHNHDTPPILIPASSSLVASFVLVNDDGGRPAIVLGLVFRKRSRQHHLDVRLGLRFGLGRVAARKLLLSVLAPV
jgi:heat shock protein beta